MSKRNNLQAVSLFASAGIGDLALRAIDADVLVANELLDDRANLYSRNFPDSCMIVGDLRHKSGQVIAEARERMHGAELDLILATPPCQGMSKNGRGKLLRGYRDGLREQIDPRNQLATAVLPVVAELNPRVVVFENVPEMQTILIEDPNANLVGLLDYLRSELTGYCAAWKVIEFADYGLPQRRQRLITVFVRSDVAADRGIFTDSDLDKVAFPAATHSSKPSLLTEPWVTVDNALKGFPALDASSRELAKSSIRYHEVPLLDAEKYWWVSNTPRGASAFDNQCVNPACLSTTNPHHSSTKRSGINRASELTPIFCHDCDALLPRPIVWDEGVPRLMKGFTSAYKRMRGDLPASALTRNLSYACSDQKIHPSEHRVLSLLEAMTLHTITDYKWDWEYPDGRPVSSKGIREAIGESIPPRGLHFILEHIRTNFLGDRDFMRRGAVAALHSGDRP